MRKTVLLLCLGFTFLFSGAQKTDRTLLYGKWKLKAMHVFGTTLYRDSLARNVENFIFLKKKNNPDAQITTADSLTLIKLVKEFQSQLATIFAQFDAKGHVTMQVPFGKKEKAEKQSGKYTWTGENTFTAQMGKWAADTYVVVSLTASELILSSDKEKGDKDYIELIYAKE